MQDSYELPDNEDILHQKQQSSTKNLILTTMNQPLSAMMTSIISPKNNRRLAHSYNTASQQSLAYSNSTYHNKLTQRSPPLFNLDFITYNNNSNNNNDQNVNTMNYCYNGQGNKNELISTFGAYGQGSRKGMAIKFDRITQQSGIESQGGGNSFFNSNNANNKSTVSGMMLNDMSLIGEGQQLIELPCFLSLENSPQNIKMSAGDGGNNKSYSKELEQLQIVDMREVLQKDSLTIPMKMKSYKKVTPSSLSSMNNRMDEQNQQNEDIEERQLTTTRRGRQSQSENNQNKKSHEHYQRPKLQKKFTNNRKSTNQQKNQSSLINSSRREDSKNNETHNRSIREIRTKKQTTTINNNLSPSPSPLSKSPSPAKKNNINNSSNKKKFMNNNKYSDNIKVISQSQQQSFSAEKDRIKQLQYELRTCEIQREQLRTRVGILNELLQEKFLQNNSLFPFRMSLISLSGNNKLSHINNNNNKRSADFKGQHHHFQQQKSQHLATQSQKLTKTQAIHKNIDLLVQMTMIKRENEELLAQNNLIKQQLENALNKSLSSQQQHKFNNRKQQQNLHQKSVQVNKTTNNFIDKKSPYQQQQHYQQQLFELKQQIKLYQQQKTQTQQTISLLQQKQTRFEQVQRPKLLQQIKQLMERVNEQKDTIEKLQMENNLIAHMKSIGSGIGGESPQKQRQMQRRGKQNMYVLTSNGKQSVIGSPNSYAMSSNNKKNSLSQQKSTAPQQIDLMSLQKDHQLSTLKKQRDYFHTQYLSSKSLQQTNYKLRLKIQDLQNQISSIRQLIEIDDEITF